MRRDVDEAEQDHRHFGGERLHRRHQLVADRDHEERIEDRKGEPAAYRLAEAGYDGALQHQDEPRLAGDRDAARFSQQPEEGARADKHQARRPGRSEEHTSELQSLMRISYAVFCLKKTTKKQQTPLTTNP